MRRKALARYAVEHRSSVAMTEGDAEEAAGMLRAHFIEHVREAETMTDMQHIATFADDALSVSVGAFSLSLTVKQIERAWDALSQFPERRARIELGALSERLNAFAGHVAAIVAKGGTLDALAELERFAVRHVSLTRRAWSMDSRCMSWFVVGPSRFPVEQNAKRQRWADAAYGAVSAHPKAAREAVEKRAFPHGAPGGSDQCSQSRRARIASGGNREAPRRPCADEGGECRHSGEPQEG